MSVTPGATPTEVNLGNTPSAQTGFRLGIWQNSSPYPDPNNPQKFVRDVSVELPNLGGVDPRTTTTETISAAAQGKLVTLTDAGAIAVTLDSTVPAQFVCAVQVDGAGAATFTPSSGTINGGATANIAGGSNLGGWLFFDGTNWWLLASGAGGGGGFYQTVQQAGTSRTQRDKLNFLAPITATDNSGNDSTDVAVPNVVGDSGSGGTSGLVPAPAAGSAAAGKFLKADGTFAVPPAGFTNGMLSITIDGAGSPPATGSKGFLQVPYDCTVVSWTMLGDVSGSAQITVKKSTYSGFPTTSSIVASAPPALSSAQKNTSSTLTGWTTSLAKGDILEFNLDSIATIARVMLALAVTRSD